MAAGQLAVRGTYHRPKAVDREQLVGAVEIIAARAAGEQAVTADAMKTLASGAGQLISGPSLTGRTGASKVCQGWIADFRFGGPRQHFS